MDLGEASRDSSGFGAIEEGLISRGDRISVHPDPLLTLSCDSIHIGCLFPVSIMIVRAFMFEGGEDGLAGGKRVSFPVSEARTSFSPSLLPAKQSGWWRASPSEGQSGGELWPS